MRIAEAFILRQPENSSGGSAGHSKSKNLGKAFDAFSYDDSACDHQLPLSFLNHGSTCREIVASILKAFNDANKDKYAIVLEDVVAL